jgi:hypothetical protein
LIAVINPILIFAMNEDFRKALWSKVGKRFVRASAHILPLNKDDVEDDGGVIKHDDTSSSSGCNDLVNKTTVAEQEWEVWLNDKEFSAAFKPWCVSNFVVENIMFYQDVQKRKVLANKVKSKVMWLLGVCAQAGDTMTMDSISEYNGELHELTVMIYEVYIQVPNAPMEVNIPASCREEIERRLGLLLLTKDQLIPALTRRLSDSMRNKFNVFNGSRGVDRSGGGIVDAVGGALNQGDESSAHGERVLTIPPFPDLSVLTVDAVARKLEDINCIFDDALKVVSHLISTDVFPRFKRSRTYAEVKKRAAEAALPSRSVLPFSIVNVIHARAAENDDCRTSIASDDGLDYCL